MFGWGLFGCGLVVVMVGFEGGEGGADVVCLCFVFPYNPSFFNGCSSSEHLILFPKTIPRNKYFKTH